MYHKVFTCFSAELSNLTPNTKYRIYVYAENGVSAVSKKQRFADTEITTQASIPQVTKLNAIDVGETYISLSWELHDDSTSQVVVLQYEILRYIKGQIGTEAVNFTTSTSITFKELKLKTEYVFQVICYMVILFKMLKVLSYALHFVYRLILLSVKFSILN